MRKKKEFVAGFISPPRMLIALLLAVVIWLLPAVQALPKFSAAGSVQPVDGTGGIDLCYAAGGNCAPECEYEECTKWVPGPSAQCPKPGPGGGCCLSTIIRCDNDCDEPPPPSYSPPSVSGAVTCDQWGGGGWCRNNARLSITASDPQGFAVSVTGSNPTFSCSGSCTINLPAGQNTATYTVTAATSGRTASNSTSWKYDPNPPTAGMTVSGTSGSNGWYVTTVSVNANGSDALSGLASSTVSSGGEWSSSLTLSDGTHTVNASASDVAGNTASSSRTIRVDTVAPSIFLSAAGSLNTSGWYTSSVELSASASDATSGVSGNVMVSLDGGSTWQAVPITLGSGTYTARFRVYDAAGNMSTSEMSLRVDTEAPAISISDSGTSGNGGWFVSSASVSAAVTDNLSGVASVQHRVDGGAWEDGTAIGAIGDGVHDIEYRATDAAGNTQIVSHNISVDTALPSVAISSSGTIGDGGWYVSLPTVTATATENVSGVASVQHRVDGGVWEGGESVTVQEGIHTVEFRVFDVAGNVQIASEELRIDTAPPISSFAPSVGGTMFTNIVSLAGPVSDAGSGVASVELSADNGANWSPAFVSGAEWGFAWDTSELPNGNRVLLLRARDVAGNVGPPVRISVTLDNHLPYVSLTHSWEIWQSGLLTVQANVIPLKSVHVILKDPMMRYPNVVLVNDVPDSTTASTEIKWDRVMGNFVAVPGTYNVEAEVCDVYGLCSNASATITIPQGAPVATSVSTTATVQPVEDEVVWIPQPPIVVPTAQVIVPQPVQPIVIEEEPALKPQFPDSPLWPTMVMGALVFMFAFLLLFDPRPAALRSLTRTIQPFVRNQE